MEREDFISLKYILVIAISKKSKAEIRKLRALNIYFVRGKVENYSIVSFFLEIYPSQFNA